MPTLVYSPHYDIKFLGLERLHPFDTRKYSRAMKLLRPQLGPGSGVEVIAPERPISDDELLTVHTPTYLERLGQPAYLAEALELGPVRILPRVVTQHFVLKPMRWAAMGTILAARAALESGFAANLSGGYHHAKPHAGEGFCVYSDIGLAVSNLRKLEALPAGGTVVYIDTDAHQGNGVCHVFAEDRSLAIFDIFNRAIYPNGDHLARGRIDCAVPLEPRTGDAEYLSQLRTLLPRFLDGLGGVQLAIYNAGTDPYFGDALGGLSLSAKGILDRDKAVLGELRARRIPTVMLPSGGYSRESYKMVASTLIWAFEASW